MFGGIAQFNEMEERMLPQKSRFPQYKMRAEQCSFFSRPKSIIEVFSFFFLQHKSKISNTCTVRNSMISVDG